MTSAAAATAERARRIAAMLERWSHEDVSGEPEWSVEELEPMTLRTPDSPARRIGLDTHRVDHC